MVIPSVYRYTRTQPIFLTMLGCSQMLFSIVTQHVRHDYLFICEMIISILKEVLLPF